ncbi:MAG: hypothetical protein AB1333_03630 [Patescibacteria group bacterium]
MTENKKGEGVDVLQVLRGVYENLVDSHELHGLIFTPRIISDVLISTENPNIVGTLEYEEGSIIRLKNSFWGLLYGTRGGNYPGNFVVNDISVVSITAEDADYDHETVCQKIHLLMKKSGNYFGFSLLHGEHTGNIHLSPRSDNIFRKLLLEKIGGQFSRFVLQEFKYDPVLIDLNTGKHRVSQTIIWKPDVVGFLSEVIEEALLEFS